MNKSELIEKAKAADELVKRFENNKLLYYKPCGEKHVAFHKSKAFIRAVFGGNRSGKTIAGLVELLFHACLKKHPFTHEVNRIPGRFRIFCQDFATIEKLMIPLLKEWIPLSLLQKGECGNKTEA